MDDTISILRYRRAVAKEQDCVRCRERKAQDTYFVINGPNEATDMFLCGDCLEEVRKTGASVNPS